MKRILSILVKVVGVLLLLGIVLIGLMQTPKGKEVVAALLSTAASRSDDIDVRIGRIHGWIPIDMRIERITLGDPQGTWLEMEDLRGQWQIGKLFKGIIHISELGAAEINWMRFPEITRQRPSKQRKPAGMQGTSLVLEGWSVDRLKLGAALAGTPLQYAVRSGGMVVSEGHISGDISISGDADGEVHFETALGADGGPRMLLRAELKQMHSPTFGLDRISGSLKATVDTTAIDATVEADVAKGDSSGHLSTRLTYRDGRLQLSEGSFDSDRCTATGDIAVTFSNKLIQVEADAALLDAQQHRYTALGQLRVYTGRDGWWVDVPGLNVTAWDLVSLNLAGRIDESKVDMKAGIAAFEVAELPFAVVSNFTGQVSGSLLLNGSPSAPDLNASLQVADFTTGAAALDELPSLDFNVGVELLDGQLFAATSLSNYYSGYLVAEASLPCSFSLMPLQWSPDPRSVDGSLDAVLDLSVFNGLTMLNNQYVNGFLTAELDLVDSVPSGFVYVEDGSYEHYAVGILCRDIEAEVEATPDGFIIRNATATDGDLGRLKYSGKMAGGQLDTVLRMSRARIIRRPEIEVMLSGELAMSGPISHPAVTGRLVVDRADLLPDNFVSSAPPLLENYEYGQETNTVSAAGKTAGALPMDIDIRLDMPDQIYVTASLIDSVWGGALDIKSVESGWWIKGRMEPRRGYVSFIGKKFDLLDGAVELDTNVQHVPVMNNLTTEYSRGELTVHIVLNGSVLRPQYRLQSVPAMPEDEILSQVLFKRDAGEITPYQAIQIAMAARQLSGGLSGPGFMYQFRRAVGVDTLEWREPNTTDGPSSVAAGKYVTPEFYVEVSSTLDSGTETGMTAEYEITRHFSVETSAGPSLRPGIGLNWRNDY